MVYVFFSRRTMACAIDRFNFYYYLNDTSSLVLALAFVYVYMFVYFLLCAARFIIGLWAAE
jgi:hypothetical protein